MPVIKSDQELREKALPDGTVITTDQGRRYTISKNIAEGGQGFTYIVEGVNGKRCFKQYKQNMLKVNPTILKHIGQLRDRGVKSDAFAWPQELVQMDYEGRELQGYIMEYVPKPYAVLSHFVMDMSKGGVRFASTKLMIDAMLGLVSAFNLLHTMGYSYQDLSLGNFMLNPETGDVKIIDNDNVSVNGKNSGILGTPGYIAPEVMMRKTSPNTYSDRYSLAVVLFYLMFRDHPLEGVRFFSDLLDEKKTMAMYCSDPVFMFDPKDGRNRPLPSQQAHVIKMWGEMPSYVRGAFEVAFSRQLMLGDPTRRVDENNWEKVLLRLRNDVLTCPLCDNDFGFKGQKVSSCPKCHQDMGPMYIIRTKHYKYPIPATYGAAVLSANLRYCNIGEGDHKELLVRRAAKDHRVLVLQNVSGKPVTVRLNNNTNSSVADKGTVILSYVSEIVMGDGSVLTVEQA